MSKIRLAGAGIGMVHGTWASGINDITDLVAKCQTPSVKSGCGVDFPGEGLANLPPLPTPSVPAWTFGLGLPPIQLERQASPWKPRSYSGKVVLRAQSLEQGSLGLNANSAEQLCDHNTVTQLCSTLCNPWTVACQASLSMGFLRGEC